MSDEKFYVDNAMNRSLGRAGMPLGSMVVSSKGSGESSSGASYFGSSQSHGETTYVDNSMNRGLGRVGMPLGSMVVSNRGHIESLFDNSDICRPLSHSERVYVDNYMNRGRDRVDMPLESFVASTKENYASLPGYNHSDSSFLTTYSESLPERHIKDYIDEPKSASIFCSRSSSPPNRDEDDEFSQLLAGVYRSTDFRKESSTSPSVYSRESCASSNSMTYVDNSMNQSLRRVDMPIGSMPVSKSSGRSSASSKTYVDNEYNRRLGRVGMEYGSMVVSKDSRIASSKGTKQYVDNPKSRSSSTSKSYVDNEYNRRVEREGMEHGSMVVSKDSRNASSKGTKQYVDNPKSKSSSTSKSYVDNEYIKRHGRVGLKHGSMDASKDSGTASSKEMKHYVDNTQNRILGRVGLPYGADAEQVRVYKDNPINRKLGRDGLPIGVAVQSNSKYLEEKSYVDNPKNRRLGRVGCLLGSRPYGTDSEEVPVYKGNLSNRKLGRAGLTIGAAVQSKSKSLQLKFYTDNRENRRLGRVGFPSGSRPKGFFSELKKTFCDNDLNKQLGTAPVTSRKKIERFHNAYQRFRENPVEDIDFGTLPTLSSEDEEDAVEQIEHVINRLQLEREWKEKEEQTRPVPKTSHDLLHYSGPIIEFSEINLGKIIGIGGFGKVYHGTYKDYVVAVRMVHVKRDDGRLKEELFDEVKILSKLDNPFIVKFIGACTIYPNFCIVMEYMQMSLHEALHVNCTDMDDITDDDRLMIIIQTLSGLKYLHDKNFAHCDIKPGNILIDHDGEKFTVAKLSDFGLNMMKNEIETSLSSDNRLACHPGTTVYSSPERLRREYLNLKKMKMSDMYSYGLVVFEILCGVQPFSNLSLRQLQLQVGWKHMYPEFPDDIYPNVHLAAKLLGCWDREPENRPTTSDFLKVMNRISCVYETLD